MKPVLIVAVVLFLGLLSSCALSKQKSETIGSSNSIDRKLLDAVNQNDLSRVKMFLDQGGDPNRIFGITTDSWAMCAATKAGSEDVLEALVNAGGEVGLWNKGSGFTERPLACAIFARNRTSLGYLLDQGASVEEELCEKCSEKNKITILGVALASRNYVLAVDLLPLVNPTKNDINDLIRTVERRSHIRNEESERYMKAFIDYLAKQGVTATHVWGQSARPR